MTLPDGDRARASAQPTTTLLIKWLATLFLKINRAMRVQCSIIAQRRFHKTMTHTSAAPTAPPMIQLRCIMARCSLARCSLARASAASTELASAASSEAASSGYISGSSSCSNCAGGQSSRVACNEQHHSQPTQSQPRVPNASGFAPPIQRHHSDQSNQRHCSQRAVSSNREECWRPSG